MAHCWLLCAFFCVNVYLDQASKPHLFQAYNRPTESSREVNNSVAFVDFAMAYLCVYNVKFHIKMVGLVHSFRTIYFAHLPFSTWLALVTIYEHWPKVQGCIVCIYQWAHVPIYGLYHPQGLVRIYNQVMPYETHDRVLVAKLYRRWDTHLLDSKYIPSPSKWRFMMTDAPTRSFIFYLSVYVTTYTQVSYSCFKASSVNCSFACLYAYVPDGWIWLLLHS